MLSRLRIFSPVEFMVALRYLRARRSERWVSIIAGFSLLGIALGVATLIIVMSVMNGFRAELLGNIIGMNGHFGVSPAQGNFTDYEAVAEDLKQVPGVVEVSPMVEGQVLATARGAATGAVARGLRPADLRARPIVADNIVTGSLADFEGSDAILIGETLRRQLGVQVGDKVRLVSPQGTLTPVGTVPRMGRYTVVGSFKSGMYQYDSAFVFMPLQAAQAYFQTGRGIGTLEVYVENPDNLDAYRRDIYNALGPGLRLFDWQQRNDAFFTALQVERTVMFLILTLIIVVAAFNIISSLIMLVKDKGRDIAILRTMGATRGMITRVFVISGASVGVIGTLVGFLLGIGFADNIDAIRRFVESLSGTELWNPTVRFLAHMPSKVDGGEVVLIVVMALGLSLLATLYPAWRASRLDPVEALRYE
jgi:lipoprotein-releasing system permease protein